MAEPWPCGDSSPRQHGYHFSHATLGIATRKHQVWKMNTPPLLTSNFACQQEHAKQLLCLGMLAKRYFPDDPNTTLGKLRQLAELLV